MGKINYSIVDVFSEGKYTGNPLAVFKNVGNISDSEMQQIAKEVNYSETTFILSDSKNDGGYDVRIFTPTENTDAKAIMVFSPDVYNLENDLNVRDFADYYGIPEDAATGSANGCLASYLVKYRYFEKGEINIRVEQGYEMERPSLLLLKAVDDNGKINVDVGGKVVKIAQGEWFL